MRRHSTVRKVASIWRDPVILTFVDEDNRELGELSSPAAVPRVGENVRLAGTPYLVERVGYDIRSKAVERIWVVCRPA
jgi:hypothetical protein